MTELFNDVKRDEYKSNAKIGLAKQASRQNLARRASLARRTSMQEAELIPKPNPPVVGKVTHCSIELYWDDALADVEKRVTRRLKTTERIKVTLQEQDRQGQWANIYAGYAKSFSVDNLNSLETYRYRMRFSVMQDVNSEWSAITQVKTIREPLTGEHLHKAIINGDLVGVGKILDTREVNIEVPDKYGFSPLMQASQRGHLEIAEMLIDRGAEIDHKNDAGKTALMLACFAGQVPVVKMLVANNNASLSTTDRGGSTAIHWAVDSNNTELLEWLLRNGGDPNIADSSTAWTPLLRLATITGNADMARVLIRRKCDVDAVDKDGKTALMTAAVNNYIALVQVLVNAGADLEIKNSYGKNSLDMARAMERRQIAKILDEAMQERKAKAKGEAAAKGK